jgi:hypothetical protein
MSSTEQTTSSSSSSNLQSIIEVALADYTKETKIDLAKNPFFAKIELMDSPESILELLQEHEKSFKEYREGNRGLMSCLCPAVKFLHVSWQILDKAASPVSITFTYLPVNLLTRPRQVHFPPAKAVFTGINVIIAVRPLSMLFNRVPRRKTTIPGRQ